MSSLLHNRKALFFAGLACLAVLTAILIFSLDGDSDGKTGDGTAPESLESGENSIQATSETRQDGLERLAKEFDVSPQALDGFVRIAKNNQVPFESLSPVLRRISLDYKSLKKNLGLAKDASTGEFRILLGLAESELEAGDFEKVSPLLEKASALKSEGEQNKGLSSGMLPALFAGLKKIRMEYGEAARLYAEAAVAAGKDNKKDYAEYLSQEGAALCFAGDPVKAEDVLRRAIEAARAAHGPDHISAALSMNNLAGLYRAQARNEEALALYEEALKIKIKVLGAEHPSTIATMNNAAVLQQSSGRLDKALELFNQTLDLKQKVFGEDHPSTAAALNNLASIYEAKGEYGKALPLVERSFTIAVQTLGPGHPHVGTALNNMGMLNQALGERKKARELFKHALFIKEKALGKDHLDAAAVLINLADLDFVEERFEEGEILCRRALGILEKSLGPEHQDVQKAEELLQKIQKGLEQ